MHWRRGPAGLLVAAALLLAPGCTPAGEDQPRPEVSLPLPGPSGTSAPSPTASPRPAQWSAPGLVDTTGAPIEVPLPAPASGVRIDVVARGADPAPGTGDDAAVIRAALAEAPEGDEVVLPAGVFDLESTDEADDTANIVLRSGVRLVGAGPGRTILRTSFDGEKDSAVLRGEGVRDVVVSGLTITSRYDGPLGTDPDDDDAGGGPMFGVALAAAEGEGSARVLIEQVHVERFQRHGISVKGSREVTVTGCHVADATSVGAGGSGYGVAIEGFSGGREPGAPDDSRHNVVRGNTFDGEHLRHAVLLQFPTHNNLVVDNLVRGSVLDAIDLHGEGEYLNEVRGNTVVDGDAAAIALGNSGGTKNKHDASGAGNWVHGNTLTGNKLGILVILGTPGTVIEDNIITADPGSRAGIELRNAPGTIVRTNTISGGDEDFWAIRLVKDRGADGRGVGIPEDVLVEQNVLTDVGNGIRVDAGADITVRGNELTKIRGTAERIDGTAAVRR